MLGVLGKNLDISGIEPEAFCMRSRRDTTTLYAQISESEHLGVRWMPLPGAPS